MGRNNQARRRMKAAARKSEARRGGSGGSGQPPGASFTQPNPATNPATNQSNDPAKEEADDELRERQAVNWLLGEALDALDTGFGDRIDDVVVSLAARCASPRTHRVVVALVEALADGAAEAWQRGWQPSDIHRLAGRSLSRAEQSLVVDVMTHELDRYAAATIDHRWSAQLRELGGEVWWPRSSSWLEARRGRGLDWWTLISQALRVLHLLARLPTLERLTPLPGTALPVARPPGSSDADQPVVDERILSRVRMLLAKAEATTFEAEAETFTAGAQSLMARHSIDAALLAAADDARHRGHALPQGRRIGIDNPYDGPKAMLLDAVAAANRCRMVWSRELGFSTVVGFESDLECVEVLFTSLLVQATRTLTSAGSRSDRYGRSRTRAFRQSFLTAYAGRIGERLREVTAGEEVTASATARAEGRELVPVLAARAQEVDDAVGAWFPKVRTQSVGSVRDAEGWHSGRAAADQARLHTGAAIGG